MLTSINFENYLEDRDLKVAETQHLINFLEREIKKLEVARGENF